MGMRGDDGIFPHGVANQHSHSSATDVGIFKTTGCAGRGSLLRKLLWILLLLLLSVVSYDPADVTHPSSLASLKPIMVYLSGAGLPGLSWKRGHWMGLLLMTASVVVVVVAATFIEVCKNYQIAQNYQDPFMCVKSYSMPVTFLGGTQRRLGTHTQNRFTALLVLSGTTQVNQHQKGKTRKVKSVWIFWSKR